jgi:hypothetical protein
MALHSNTASITEIAKQMSALLDQQMQAISSRRLRELTDEEADEYKLRQEQIAALRAELNALAHPN